ncbi:transmembrane protein, putative (macronuclear) [Tetrahymena thermophila SB210]|uniref:Transmembrane protein, putative n=1 Tax=Tetrahymena thermophila (strain SB210) TaxID=312017 RepID=A4VEQ7_TETTS|nr:transmembrane protein, putative [Tetrahymena thermophila SB210]EDK32033.1 transmembrane protein, putative [Tetrahymena thermophila SB210]|eukprot:XP_001471127.1 transmembrane protein, putative [Tetrahymena thermophila SB210]
MNNSRKNCFINIFFLVFYQIKSIDQIYHLIKFDSLFHIFFNQNETKRQIKILQLILLFNIFVISLIIQFLQNLLFQFIRFLQVANQNIFRDFQFTIKWINIFQICSFLKQMLQYIVANTLIYYFLKFYNKAT